MSPNLGRVARLRNLLPVAVLLFFANAPIYAASWTTYEVPTAGFAVEVPDEPIATVSVTAVPENPDGTQVLSFSRNVEAKETYDNGFSCLVDVPPVSLMYRVEVRRISPRDNLWEGALLKAPPAAKAVTRVEQSGVKGIQYETENGRERTHVRAFVADRKIYTLTLSTKNGFISYAHDTWFDSWRLLNPVKRQ